MTPTPTKLLAYLWVWIGLIYCDEGLACQVCGVAEGAVQDAFILTTGILTAVPLILFGGFIYTVLRILRNDDDDLSAKD